MFLYGCFPAKPLLLAPQSDTDHVLDVVNVISGWCTRQWGLLCWQHSSDNVIRQPKRHVIRRGVLCCISLCLKCTGLQLGTTHSHFAERALSCAPQLDPHGMELQLHSDQNLDGAYTRTLSQTVRHLVTPITLHKLAYNTPACRSALIIWDLGCSVYN